MEKLQRPASLRPDYQRTRERSSSKETKIKERTAPDAGHGFLKNSFPPVRPCLPGISDPGHATSDFLESLGHLCALYRIGQPTMPNQPFPGNVMALHKWAEETLRENKISCELILTDGPTGKLCLATRNTFNTGMTLYYIPVGKVNKLLTGKNTRPLGKLLVTAMAYLYHVVGIPFYRHQSSYLFSIYQRMWEWISNEWDGSKTVKRELESLLKKADKTGDGFFKYLNNKKNVASFEKTVNRFTAKNPAEHAILETVAGLLQLYRDFPHTSMQDIVPDIEDLPHDESTGERPICFDQYMSFVYETESSLFGDMEEYINADFQECPCMQEPVAYQLFDCPQVEPLHDHRFAERLFPLLDALNHHLHHSI